jgi:hypothetical protein
MRTIITAMASVSTGLFSRLSLSGRGNY